MKQLCANEPVQQIADGRVQHWRGSKVPSTVQLLIDEQVQVLTRQDAGWDGEAVLKL
jgi:hypothetical protein